MRVRSMERWPFVVVLASMAALVSCGGGGGGPSTAPPAAVGISAIGVATSSPTNAPSGSRRSGFLGAFFRPEGAPPFGVFAASAAAVAPNPYPSPGAALFGPAGYCTQVAANGVSIESGTPVDPTKLADIVNLGVKWTRSGPAEFFDDRSHVFGAGNYAFGDFDSAQCSLVQNGITPLIALEAGPVEYDAVPGTFSPQQQAIYASAGDFGQWCGVVAAHEARAFPGVTRYSSPGNEINSNTQPFAGGNAQIAQYAMACYAAIKAAQPQAFVYGFELNMMQFTQPAAFVSAMAALGCKVGTCYDGLSVHLSIAYPPPPAGTPCYPGGSMQCIADIRAAAGAPVHVIVGETGYNVPSSVPDEATKAKAIVAEMQAFAADPLVDGALYNDVDECGLYPTGYFSGGCLIDTAGNVLPAYTALAGLASTAF